MSGGPPTPPVPAGMGEAAVAIKKFPRNMNEPDEEIVRIQDTPWLIKILSLAEKSLVMTDPVVVTYVCQSGADWNVGKAVLETESESWVKEKKKLTDGIRARLTGSMVPLHDGFDSELSEALERARKAAFLRVVRDQARAFLEVVTSEDATRVWQEEEINIILEQ